MTYISSLLGRRRLQFRTAAPPRQFRPRLEALEARDVPSASSLAPPALGPALASTAATVQQAASLFPISVTSVSVTGVANNALQLVANATTAGGQALQIPLTLTNTTPNTPNPILNLHVGAIDLNVLGLRVTTSEICLKITTPSGASPLSLGGVLGSVANVLDQGLSTSTLSPTQLTTLDTGLTNLLNGVFGAIGSPTNAATGGASVSSTSTTQILHLTLQPVDLTLLGLNVHLDNCNNGPITVDITAQSGPGNLLGNLLGGLSHLLDSSANTQALLNKLDKIAGEILAIL